MDSTMFCRKCGREIRAEMRFCPKCGEPVRQNSIDSAEHTHSVIGNHSKQKPETVVRIDMRKVVLAIVCLGVLAIIAPYVLPGRTMLVSPESSVNSSVKTEEANVPEKSTLTTEEQGMIIPEDAYTFGGHSYYLYDNDCSTWDEILNYCHERGGYPAVVNTSAENEFLYDYMINMGRIATFIGYTDRETEGVWKWVDGKKSKFSDWGFNDEGDAEPNADTDQEDYAQMDINMHNGHWNDCAFGWDTVSFFCEWDAINN